MVFEKTCRDDLIKLIKQFQKDDLFKDYYLVGGTSLALQLGHRESEDIDLFTLGEQNNDKILEYINKNKVNNLKIINNNDNILQIIYDGIKVDFVKAKGTLISEPVIENGMKLCSFKDIAGMKLNTINQITGRKQAKDYIDIAFLIKELTLPVMFNIYKFISVQNNFLGLVFAIYPLKTHGISRKTTNSGSLLPAKCVILTHELLNQAKIPPKTRILCQNFYFGH